VAETCTPLPEAATVTPTDPATATSTDPATVTVAPPDPAVAPSDPDTSVLLPVSVSSQAVSLLSSMDVDRGTCAVCKFLAEFVAVSNSLTLISFGI
jgi:hypothetical protein